MDRPNEVWVVWPRPIEDAGVPVFPYGPGNERSERAESFAHARGACFQSGEPPWEELRVGLGGEYWNPAPEQKLVPNYA